MTNIILGCVNRSQGRWYQIHAENMIPRHGHRKVIECRTLANPTTTVYGEIKLPRWYSSAKHCNHSIQTVDGQTDWRTDRQVHGYLHVFRHTLFQETWDIQMVFIWVRYGEIQHCPMNNVWAFRRTSYSLDMCCSFQYRTENEQRLHFPTRSSHTWHNHPIHCSLNFTKSAIWADKDIRLKVKTTAQNVIIMIILRL